MSYQPGKSLILSRLPAKDWFSLDEAAEHSGWSRSFVRSRIVDGTLAAQEFQAPGDPARLRRHRTYRIHVDDLAVFIIRHGAKRYGEEKPFRDVAMILRTWPAWMRREMLTFLERSLSAPATPPAAPPAPGSPVA